MTEILDSGVRYEDVAEGYDLTITRARRGMVEVAVKGETGAYAKTQVTIDGLRRALDHLARQMGEGR